MKRRSFLQWMVAVPVVSILGLLRSTKPSAQPRWETVQDTRSVHHGDDVSVGYRADAAAGDGGFIVAKNFQLHSISLVRECELVDPACRIIR